MVEAERAAKRQTIHKATTGPRSEMAERVQAALRDDARTRGEQAVTADPDQRLLDHLGPVPKDPTARNQWIEAAGRVAQHHSLWSHATGSALVGPMPPLGNAEYAITYYSAKRAIDATGPNKPLHRARESLSL